MQSRKTVSPRGRDGFRRISEALSEQIQSGTFVRGQYLPTERELQNQFKASRSTIRRALADLVESGWAENVPNKGVIARPGVRRIARTHEIALIDTGTFVLKVLFLRFSKMLREHGFQLVHLGADQMDLESALEYARDKRFAGALVWPHKGYVDVERVQRIAAELPIVALDHRLRGIDTDFSTFDYHSAATLAVRHLLEQGRKRVAVSGMLDMLETTHARFGAYMQALFDAGLRPEVRDYAFNFTSAMDAPDSHLLRRRLLDADRPDAVFVMQDEFVPAVVETAIECGLSLPGDLAISTLGDEVDLSVDGCGLTSVALDWETMAANAVQLLMERIASPSLPTRTQVAPHRLVVRGLCGTPRGAWTDDAPLGGFRGELPIPRSVYRFASMRAVTPPVGDGRALVSTQR